MSKLILKSILALGATGLMAMAQQPASPTPDTQTPETQRPSTRAPKAASSDTQMTMKVRQAIMSDTALGADAHNVRVSTKNGTVTLRGKVGSQQDKDMIVQKAQEVAGASNVKDNLSVAKK